MRRCERIAGFVEEIWKWYDVHKRRLPWRDLGISNPTEHAYRILVSEIMLQQTQVERVKEIYIRFLREFPTLRDLARASNREVVLAWRGMGYNSRALRLRDAARVIIADHGGVFPQEYAALQAINGLGAYTAAAILNFAFDIPTPCLDTNIRRILHRTFVGPERADGTWEKDDKFLLNIAEEVLRKAVQQRKTASLSLTPADWHAALMDFGSLVQTKRNPKWDVCPLTAKGLMKTTQQSFERALRAEQTRVRPAREPGRHIGGRFTPNRIIRGKILNELRDAPAGLPFGEIGQRICADWSRRRHEKWLRGILASLKRDAFVAERSRKFVLAE